MKILCSLYNFHHQPLAGGEIYITNLINYLRTQGHEFRIITGDNTHYVYDGIDCYPQGEGIDMFTKNNEHCEWADVILCHLIGTAWGYNKAVQHNKPLIWIAHNNSKAYPVRFAKEANVIYNSYQLRDDLHSTFGRFNTIVCHPTIQQFKPGNGNKITLINCSHNKGGHILGAIAELLPQYEFLGVYGGYQDQIECHLPNVTYLPNGMDMRGVYKQTKILICPSEFESYGQVGSEALTAGIPVIAHPTPGLKENLAYAGIFIDRNDIKSYVNKILYLLGNESAYNNQSQLSLQRAASCKEMNDAELVKLNNWLNKIV